jgi:hypothetical protein
MAASFRFFGFENYLLLISNTPLTKGQRWAINKNNGIDPEMADFGSGQGRREIGTRRLPPMRHKVIHH